MANMLLHIPKYVLQILICSNIYPNLLIRIRIPKLSVVISFYLHPRSHAIEMVFVFLVTGHAASSARSFMLSQKKIAYFLRLWVSDPVQSPVTKCPLLYLNCRRACLHRGR